ncbi:MAG: alpha/beta hydrolase family protein [Peptococcaceae bacterium]
MFEQEVEYKVGNNLFSATIALPAVDGKFPGVVLIPGSGQVDRNENVKGYPINIFKEIAHFLAENGIASLRYDKRGVGKSGGDYWSTGFYDNSGDVSSIISYFKNHSSINSESVFLLGHSEGAIIATRLAGTGTDVSGIILLAGSCQNGETLLKWQSRQVVKGLTGFNAWLIKTFHIDVAKAQQKQIDKIKKSTGDSLRIQLVNKINAKWMREFLDYNPAVDFPNVKCPILAITGSKDIQVDPADLKKMEQLVKTDFESHELADITHMIRPDKGKPSLSAYKTQMTMPMDAGILNIILNWLEKRI